jgi:hypothetical protein
MKIIAFIERRQTEVTCLPAGRSRRFCGTAGCGNSGEGVVSQQERQNQESPHAIPSLRKSAKVLSRKCWQNTGQSAFVASVPSLLVLRP